jgi:hypothetical protein
MQIYPETTLHGDAYSNQMPAHFIHRFAHRREDRLKRTNKAQNANKLLMNRTKGRRQETENHPTQYGAEGSAKGIALSRF